MPLPELPAQNALEDSSDGSVDPSVIPLPTRLPFPGLSIPGGSGFCVYTSRLAAVAHSIPLHVPLMIPPHMPVQRVPSCSRSRVLHCPTRRRSPTEAPTVPRPH